MNPKASLGLCGVLAQVLCVGGCAQIPASSATEPHRLECREKLPVKTEESLHDDRYFAFDLNDDGRNEYFAIDIPGAHSATILLLDSNGHDILGPEPLPDLDATSQPGADEDEWHASKGISGCDFILILEDKHQGYRDFISIVENWAGPKAQEWTLWTYEKGRYQSKRVRNESTFSWYHSPYPPLFKAKLGVWNEPRPLRIRAYIEI